MLPEQVESTAKLLIGTMSCTGMLLLVISARLGLLTGFRNRDQYRPRLRDGPSTRIQPFGTPRIDAVAIGSLGS